MMRAAAALAVVLALHAGEKKRGEKELTCSKEVYRRLNKAVGEACKAKPLSCEESFSCELLRQRWQAMADCITARQQLMATCFGGGDERHQEKVDEHTQGLEWCNFYLSQKKCDRSGLHRRPVIVIQVVPCTQPCKDEEDAYEETQQAPGPAPHRGGVPISPVPGR